MLGLLGKIEAATLGIPERQLQEANSMLHVVFSLTAELAWLCSTGLSKVLNCVVKREGHGQHYCTMGTM